MSPRWSLSDFLIFGIRPRVLTSPGVTGVVGHGASGSVFTFVFTSCWCSSLVPGSTFIFFSLGPVSSTVDSLRLLAAASWLVVVAVVLLLCLVLSVACAVAFVFFACAVSGLVLLPMIWCSAVKKSFNSLALISFIFLSRDCAWVVAVSREKNEGDQGEGVERLLNRRAPDHTQEHQAGHYHHHHQQQQQQQHWEAH